MMTSHVLQTCREFARLFDIYYWKTAFLLARNQLGKKYRNSFLGMLWTLLQPMTMVAVYTLIMPMIMRFPTEDYVLYIISSLPLWTFISSSLVASSGSILGSAETLKRCMISSTVFPLADVIKNTYTYVIAFVVMYGVATMFFVDFRPTVLLVPLFLVPILIFLGCASIAIAFTAPYVRDIGDFILMSMNMLIWLTPIFYPASILPDYAMAIMQWNPFYILIHPIQMLAYEGVFPSMADILRLGALMMITVAISYGLYRLCRRNYVYYL